MEEQWTILKVLQWTAGYFSRKGVEQPRSDAEVLLASMLGMERIQLYLHFDQPLSAEELARFRELVKRRADREPVQYITGKQEFWSLEFCVSPSVLIPRPETELLVEKALEILCDAPALILDIGTGSGAIAVSLAHERPSFRVIAADKSIDALKVAKRNAIRHHVDERVFFISTDLFSAFNSDNASFDMIISNPPYIGESEFANLAPEISRYEPQEALRGGGSQGLSIIQRILDQYTRYLAPGGTLLIEIEHGQAEILRAELTGNPEIESFEFLRDYSGILRVLQIRRSDR